MEYPHLENRRNMLCLLSDTLDVVRREHGDPQLMLWFRRGSSLTGEAELAIYQTRQDVAEGLGLSGAEAIGLLRELGDDGYLRLDYGKYGPNASSGVVPVRFSEKGRAAIEQLPNPNQELVLRLDLIAAAIEGLQEIDPEEKTRAQQAVGELKTFGRNISPSAALEIIKAVARGDLPLM